MIITKSAVASAFAVLLAGVLSAQPSEAAYLKGSQAKSATESGAIPSEEIGGNLTHFRQLTESDENDPPVCRQDGVFYPNAKKYYTIESGSGRYWSAGSDEGGHEPFNRAIRLSTNKTQTSSHWRFEYQGSRKWLIRNRMTGMSVDRDSIHYNLETTDSSKTSSDFIVKGQCFGSEKFILKSASNHREAAFCESNSCGSGKKIVVATPRVLQSKTTSCRYPTFLDTCEEYFASASSPIWVESDYKRCGLLGGKRYRVCDEIRMEDRTDDPEEQWIIREVKEFTKPDVKDPPVISVLQGTVEGVKDGLVDVGLALGAFIANDLVKNGAPGFGLLASIGSIVGQFGDEDKNENDALAKLATEILETVDNRISEAIVKRDLEVGANLLKIARDDYLIHYREDKKTKFQSGSLDRISLTLLSDDLDDYGKDYVNAMAKLSAGPGDYSFGENDINVLRAQHAWSTMKLAMVETLMLYQEAVAMDAFISATFEDVTFTCDDIFKVHFHLNDIVDDFRSHLKNTRNMLVKYRVEKNAVSPVLKEKKCQVCSLCSCHRYTCGHIKVGVRDDLRGIQFESSSQSNSDKLVNLWNAELRFDMIYHSYSIEKEIEFFKTYKENTMLLCETMMNDPTARQIFAEAI